MKVQALSVIAAILTIACVACVGTRAAYNAAKDTGDPSVYADVIGEHYFALLKEANALKDAGTDAASVAKIQDADTKAGPLVKAMLNASAAYKANQSAETQAELQSAMNAAVKAVSEFIDAVKAVRPGGVTQLTPKPPEALAFLPAS